VGKNSPRAYDMRKTSAAGLIVMYTLNRELASDRGDSERGEDDKKVVGSKCGRSSRRAQRPMRARAACAGREGGGKYPIGSKGGWRQWWWVL
jgi:hypothetical protein